jgi:1-acyl-sn-glycerol-3-phosphate acyltransferase
MQQVLKKGLYFIIGILSYPGIALFNKLKVSGMEKLRHLPKQNVLFVSNHHTYFADVITFLHIFCASSWGKKKGLGIPYYLVWPFTKVKYVAAATTMNSTFIAKIFTLAGAVTVKRTWNAGAGEALKGLEISDTRNILQSLENNWVITFPQGTTTPFSPGRKGTAFIIRQYNPIVIPVVIHGFRDTFDKTGLKIKKWGSKLSVEFKDPLVFQSDESSEEIMQKVMDAIEQSEKFNPNPTLPSS